MKQHVSIVFEISVPNSNVKMLSTVRHQYVNDYSFKPNLILKTPTCRLHKPQLCQTSWLHSHRRWSLAALQPADTSHQIQKHTQRKKKVIQKSVWTIYQSGLIFQHLFTFCSIIWMFLQTRRPEQEIKHWSKSWKIGQPIKACNSIFYLNIISNAF